MSDNEFGTAETYRKVLTSPLKQTEFYMHLGLRAQIAQEAAKWSKDCMV